MEEAAAGMAKSCDDFSRPYKVSFPGQYDPYESWRPSKDPRLGGAQKAKEEFYKQHGYDDDDDDDVGPFEDKIEDYYPVKSYRQNWKKTLKRDLKYEAKAAKKTDCDCAEAAINFYNQKHGTDYNIVETLGSYEYLGAGGFWFHCNFRAQCKSHPSPPKLFFAELNRIEYDQLIVKVCMPLDNGLGNRSSIVRGCEMCGNHLLHPINGFQAGRIVRG